MKNRVFLLLVFVLMSPALALATSYDEVGDYEVVVCGEEKVCETVSADFDFRNNFNQLFSWIDAYNREYHADDLFLLRTLPLRQVGLFVESHTYNRKLEKFLEFEDNSKYYIMSTARQTEASDGYEISQADLEKLNDYLDWYVAYYEQTDGLRNDMVKVYAVLVPLLVVLGGVVGYRKYRKNTNVSPPTTGLS